MHWLTASRQAWSLILGIHKHAFREAEKKSAAKSLCIYTNTYQTKISIKNPERDSRGGAGPLTTAAGIRLRQDKGQR